ncbi:hypothetical protein [Leeuwenhoekiella sp. NPDC079379]|uniref:hypothetical protein n=1 Tax=Leeuwenhoekiella sp. NPDC079379 TaxID=3364122 RepID=UPI0037CCA435|tara:strand:+ start:7386 stop:7613 length:228 start_codon:yes stop_codon:yes gene_type:complete
MENKSNLSGLINKVRDKPKPIQKINPIQPKKNETQFSFWIDSQLLKELKLLALKEDQTLKALVTKSIKAYLKKDN